MICRLYLLVWVPADLLQALRKVEEAIRAELAKFNIKAVIEITGCIGYCAREVIVDIKFPVKRESVIVK
jgi:sulfite reductase beta subunit-like hemoprotein